VCLVLLQEKKELNIFTDEEEVKLAAVKLPFSDSGACRWPFRARLQPPHKGVALERLGGEDVVIKLFRDGSRDANTEAAYRAQMETQSVAAAMAKFFDEVRPIALSEMRAGAASRHVSTFLPSQHSRHLGIVPSAPAAASQRIVSFSVTRSFRSTVTLRPGTRCSAAHTCLCMAQHAGGLSGAREALRHLRGIPHKLTCLPPPPNTACAALQECKKKAPGTPKLEYLRPATFVSTGKSDHLICNVERLLKGGKMVKFTNNAGYVNTEHCDDAEFCRYADALSAFSHWSFEASSETLMVTDLQVCLRWVVRECMCRRVRV
jgi:hypothetical protein